FSFILTSSYYMKDRPKLFTFLVWASYTLPALAFVFYIYGTIISTGLTPITNAAMSRANGTMLDALFLMIPISYITAHFFRKTRNLYIAGFLNAMIFAWIAVGTDLITFIG